MTRLILDDFFYSEMQIMTGSIFPTQMRKKNIWMLKELDPGEEALQAQALSGIPWPFGIVLLVCNIIA